MFVAFEVIGAIYHELPSSTSAATNVIRAEQTYCGTE